MYQQRTGIIMKEIKEISINDELVEKINNRHSLIKAGEDVIDAFLNGKSKLIEYYDTALLEDSSLLPSINHRLIFIKQLFEHNCILKDKGNNLYDISPLNHPVISSLLLKSEEEFENEKKTENARAIESSKYVISSLIEGEIKKKYDFIRTHKETTIKFTEKYPCHDWMSYWYLILKYLSNKKQIIIFFPDTTVNIKNNEVTIAELKQKKRQDMK